MWDHVFYCGSSLSDSSGFRMHSGTKRSDGTSIYLGWGLEIFATYLLQPLLCSRRCDRRGGGGGDLRISTSQLMEHQPTASREWVATSPADLGWQKFLGQQ